MILLISLFFFFFNDTATTEIYTLSLHDALPISVDRELHRSLMIARTRPGTRRGPRGRRGARPGRARRARRSGSPRRARDRKSTRLNSSHGYISYAVFCLKKKKHTKERESVTTSV